MPPSFLDAVLEATRAGDAALLRHLATERAPNTTAHGMAVRAYANGCADEIDGNAVEAAANFERALALEHDLGDRRIQAAVVFRLGNAYDRSGQTVKAIEQMKRALALHEELDDRAAVATTTGRIGALYQQTGNYQLALEICRKALADFERLGDRVGIAKQTGEIGTTYYYTGDYRQALEHWQRAAAALEELGEISSLARVTGNMGNVHHYIGEHAQAIELYQRALDLHTKINDLGSAANITRNLANVYRSIGSYALALEHFDRALARFEELGNKSGIAQTTCSIGLIYVDIGDFPLSLTYLHRGLALHEELGDRASAALVTGHIGGVHAEAGDLTQALDHLQRSFSVLEELGERTSVARVTGNIGLVYARHGDHALALEYYNRALTMHAEMGNQVGMNHIRGNILDVLLKAERYVDAESVLSALDAATNDDPRITIAKEIGRAKIQRHQGRIDVAMHTLTSALAIAQEHALPAQQAELHEQLRDLCEPRNDLAGYIAHNREFTRITAEINGRDTSIKMAIQEKQREIDAVHREHQRHMTVLHSTLPKHIAERVARGEKVNDQHENTAVLFLDVAGFTTNSAQLDAGSVVDLLQKIFTTFDAICAERNAMKIKTIGDAYMAVAFPSDHHVEDLAAVALAMRSAEFTWPHTGERVQFRIGLHIGPVIAGVLGTERIQYDVWGDTVNVASRMESSGEAGRIHISEAFALNLKSNTEYTIQNAIKESRNQGSHEVLLVTGNLSLVTTFRGMIDIKGKGPMQTYWLESTT